MLVSGALLSLSLILTNIVDSRQKKQKETRETGTGVTEPLKKGNGFKILFQSKYLVLIAFLLMFLNWVNTTGEYILGRTIAKAAEEAVKSASVAGLTEGIFIGKFYADFFLFVNIAGVVTQLFLVSRILKYLGVRIAILVLPLIALCGYSVIAFLPILGIIRLVKISENSTDYSLNNTVRHVLFLPTTREEKYKAKQATDTFFVRAGDVLSALLVYVGVNMFAFDIKQFALVNLGLVLIWLLLALTIGIENKKLVSGQSQKSREPTL